MGNKQRAEVDLVGTDGSVYRFRLGTGALCQLEETLNLDVPAIHEKLQQGLLPLSILREMVKAAAVDPPITSNEAAHAVIDDVGVVPALQAMQQAFVLAMNVGTSANANGNGTAPSPPAPPVRTRARRATGAGISTAAPS